MDVFEAVRTVLAVRKFDAKPVPASLVRRIVEAGWLTGSAMNAQPWHFIAVDDPATLQKLGGLARSGPYIAQAPLAVAVVVEDTQFALSDASRAIQSMVLTAWAEGVGSNWVGFFGLDEVNALLEIPPGFKILALVPFGYPAEELGKGKKKRKEFEAVVYKGKFGQKFE